jgi:hypothetical protein
MIKGGAQQNYRAASLLRRDSTGDDQPRPRAARDSRRVVRSRAGDASSAHRNRPTGGRHTLDRFPHKRSTDLGNRQPAPKSP